MKYIQYIGLCLVVAFFSCSDDLGNYDYKQLNDVKISGIPTDTTAQMTERLVLKPVLEQALISKESDLTFVWCIGSDTVSTDKELDYEIPITTKFGVNQCHYTVTDVTTGVRCFAPFELNVTSAYSSGYYILSEQTDETALISYIKAEFDEETSWQMTDMIGSVKLGKKPRQMTNGYSYMSEYDGYGWTMFFLTEEGEYPVIETNSFTFQPTSLVNNENYVGGGEGKVFAPKSVVKGNAASYYQSGDGFAIFSQGLLNPPASLETDYNWLQTGLWQMGQTIDVLWGFDGISNNLYTISYTESDPLNGIVGNKYLFDNFQPIEGFPSFDGYTFMTADVNSDWSSDYSSKTEKVEVVLFNSSSVIIHTKKTVQEYKNWAPQGDPVVSFDQTELPVTGITSNSICKILEGDYYFIIGNSIYSSPALNPKLTKVADVPEELGAPLKMEMSVKGSMLWVATYNESDAAELKGSVVVVNTTDKKVEHTFKNVCAKPADIMTADASPW
jgi:hypothetical protein